MTIEKDPSAVREQMLVEHRQINELTARLVDARDPEHMLPCLQQLHSLLRTHFATEERKFDGLHAGIRARTPGLERDVDKLRQEHRVMLDHLRDLVTAATAAERERASLHALSEQFQELLAEHEQKETGMLIDSIWTDVGEGD